MYDLILFVVDVTAILSTKEEFKIQPKMSHHSPETTVLLLWKAFAHVGQVGHAAPVGSVQGAAVLLDALTDLVLAVLDLGEFASSLQHTYISLIPYTLCTFSFFLALLHKTVSGVCLLMS